MERKRAFLVQLTLGQVDRNALLQLIPFDLHLGDFPGVLLRNVGGSELLGFLVQPVGGVEGLGKLACFLGSSYRPCVERALPLTLFFFQLPIVAYDGKSLRRFVLAIHIDRRNNLKLLMVAGV